MRIFIFTYVIVSAISFKVISSEATNHLSVLVSDVEENGFTILWPQDSNFEETTVKLEKCLYENKDTCEVVLNQVIQDPSTHSYQIKDGISQDTQYRLTVIGVDSCGHRKEMASFVIFRKQNYFGVDQIPFLHFGPVHPTNLTLHWSLPIQDGVMVSQRHDRHYRVSWKKVDEKAGHPGHEASVISNAVYIIKGLIPGDRYEVCISEKISTDQYNSVCDVISTLDGVPGPPVTLDSWCVSAAHGTHWRCDVKWYEPLSQNGKVIGYKIYWKDKEGYSLYEDMSQETSCSAMSCKVSHIVTFKPQEGCVAAMSSMGEGWISCAPVHDVQSRILSYFEAEVLYIVVVTLLLYILGPRLLGTCLRCCIRTLAKYIQPTPVRHIV